MSRPWYFVLVLPTPGNSQILRSAGIDAGYVYSKTPAVERRFLVESFMPGKHPVLVGYLRLPSQAQTQCLQTVQPSQPRAPKSRTSTMLSSPVDTIMERRDSDCSFLMFFFSSWPRLTPFTDRARDEILLRLGRKTVK